MKKYLKLVNVPLTIFKEARYGKRIGGGSIPWVSMGFNVIEVSEKALQYYEVDGSYITYLPIYDENLLNNIFHKIEEDILDLEKIFPDNEYSAEIVNDDRVLWFERSKFIKEQNNLEST